MGQNIRLIAEKLISSTAEIDRINTYLNALMSEKFGDCKGNCMHVGNIHHDISCQQYVPMIENITRQIDYCIHIVSSYKDLLAAAFENGLIDKKLYQAKADSYSNLLSKLKSVLPYYENASKRVKKALAMRKTNNYLIISIVIFLVLWTLKKIWL